MWNVCTTNGRQQWAGYSNILGRLGVKKTTPNQCGNTDRGLTQTPSERWG